MVRTRQMAFGSSIGGREEGALIEEVVGLLQSLGGEDELVGGLVLLQSLGEEDELEELVVLLQSLCTPASLNARLRSESLPQSR